jgi:hypothetical protein
VAGIVTLTGSRSVFESRTSGEEETSLESSSCDASNSPDFIRCSAVASVSFFETGSIAVVKLSPLPFEVCDVNPEELTLEYTRASLSGTASDTLSELDSIKEVFG